MNNPGTDALPIFRALAGAQAHAKAAFENATGMSIIRFVLLERIEAEPNDNAIEHVRRGGLPTANHAYNFSEMERLGLIERWPGPAYSGQEPDRRAAYYKLKPEGEKALEKARAAGGLAAINLFSTSHLRAVKALLNQPEWMQI